MINMASAHYILAHPEHRPIAALPVYVGLVVSLLEHFAQVAKQPVWAGARQLPKPPSRQRIKAIQRLQHTALPCKLMVNSFQKTSRSINSTRVCLGLH